MDDYELQKNELLRLLHTANSEERRQHIQNALDALDKVAENPSLLPAQASHLFHVPVETVTGANTRPYSARRRSSIKLHVIPEELAKYRTSMATVEEENRGEGNGVNANLQVAKITATSCDPRFPPYYLLQATPRPWVSTGLAPQVLSLHFESAFIVKRLELYCAGVQAVEVQSSPLHTSCPLRCEKTTQHGTKHKCFVLEAENDAVEEFGRSDNNGNDSDTSDFVSSKRETSPILSGGTVNQLHFVVTNLSGNFCIFYRILLST